MHDSVCISLISSPFSVSYSPSNTFLSTLSFSRWFLFYLFCLTLTHIHNFFHSLILIFSSSPSLHFPSLSLFIPLPPTIYSVSLFSPVITPYLFSFLSFPFLPPLSPFFLPSSSYFFLLFPLCFLPSLSSYSPPLPLPSLYSYPLPTLPHSI